MKSRFMKALSAMLSVCMVITAIPTASAVDSASNTGTNNPGENLVNDVSVTGTNSFGKMFSEIYNENSSKQETTGYGVYSVEFTDNVATVKYDTLQTATLVVGLFEEKNSSSMIISEEIEVTKDNTVTEITFDSAKMPEYFYVKAYLVDSETFRPLSTEYTSPMYTEDMQKLEKLSTTDFPEEQVLNLDNNTESNFAVYNSDVKVVSETAETNIVKTVDDTNGVYVFENIDSSISSLKPGDTFSYAYGEEDGLIIAKVSNITIDGTTATITSDELEMDQVFDYVKIDVAPTINQAEISTDELPEGVVYNALAGDNTRAKVSRGVAPVPSGFGISDDKTSSLVFELFDVKPNEIYKKKTGSELSNKNPLKYITINGSLSAEITPGIEYKFAIGDDYFQFKVDYSVGFNVTCTAEYEYEKPTETTQPTEPGNSDATEPGNSDATEPGNSDATESGNSDATESVNSDDVVTRNSGAIGVESSSSIIDKYVTIGLGSLIFTPVAGVTIKITPGFAFSVSGEISIAGSLSGTSGFKISDGVWEDLTTTPKLEIELKVEASLFIGISLNPEASFLAGLAEAELEGVLGVEVSGSMSLLSADTGEGFYVEPSVHDCDKCIAGEVVAKLTISFSANILDKDKLKLEADLLNIEFKISDFYYSFDHKSFGFTECPFQKHRITVNTVDSSGEAIKFVEITIKDINGELVKIANVSDYKLTDQKGKVFFYLQPGEYTITASSGEYTLSATDDLCKYEEATKKLIVSDNAKSISIKLFTHDEILDDYYDQGDETPSIGVTEDTPYKYIVECDKYSVVKYQIYNMTHTVIGYEATNYTVPSHVYVSPNRYTEYFSIANGVFDCFFSEYGGNKLCIDESIRYSGGDLVYGSTWHSFIDTLYFNGVKLVQEWSEDRSGFVLTANGINIVQDGYIMGTSIPVSTGICPDGIWPNKKNFSDWLNNLIFDNTLSSTVSTHSNSNTVLSSTPNVTTAVTSGISTSATKSFEGLMPNETYNFYAMKSKNALEPLSSENLLYISQAISDENGNLTIDYTMTEDYSKAVCFVVPMKQTDLSSAIVTMDNLEYNGEEQFINPTVTLDGVTLTQGKDYELCNHYYAQNPGEYKVIVRGISNYTGEVEFTYYVNSKLGDVNLDGNITVVDVILTLKHIVNGDILNSQGRVYADVNKDRIITVVDAIMIQRIIIGLIPSA